MNGTFSSLGAYSVDQATIRPVFATLCDWPQELALPGQRPRRPHGGDPAELHGQLQGQLRRAVGLHSRHDHGHNRATARRHSAASFARLTSPRRLAGDTSRSPPPLVPLNGSLCGR
jgi:hypothetical protein